MRRRPDTSLARQKLGWESRVPLEDGIARTVAWFEKRLAESRPDP